MASSRALIYVLFAGNLYGTERMALATLQALPEYAQRIVLAPPAGAEASVVEAARGQGIEAHTFATKLELAQILARLLRRHRDAVVICTSVVQSYVCFAVGWLLRARPCHFQVVHGGIDMEAAFGRKRYLGWIRVPVVAISHFVQRQLLRLGVADRSMIVVPNFLSDRDRAEIRRRDRYAQTPAVTRVVVVSRLDPMKRIDVLIDCVATHGLADFAFDVYGSGSAFDALRSRAAELPNVRLHGHVPDTRDRIASAEIFLHLCPQEPFGLAILEAFEAGVVVVSADEGGAAELVVDGANGFTFKANDIDSLHEVLQRVRKLPSDAMQRIADAARRSLDTDYSEDGGRRRYRLAIERMTDEARVRRRDGAWR